MKRLILEFRRHWFAWLVALFVVAPLTYMGFDREPPVDRMSGSMEPNKVHPGQMVTVTWYTKKHRRCNGDVSRQIIAADGKVHILEDADSSYSTQGDLLKRTFQIPIYIAYGPARYRSTVQFYCNPIHTYFPIKTVGPEVLFEIIPP